MIATYFRHCVENARTHLKNVCVQKEIRRKFLKHFQCVTIYACNSKWSQTFSLYRFIHIFNIFGLCYTRYTQLQYRSANRPLQQNIFQYHSMWSLKKLIFLLLYRRHVIRERSQVHFKQHACVYIVQHTYILYAHTWLCWRRKEEEPWESWTVFSRYLFFLFLSPLFHSFYLNF